MYPILVKLGEWLSPQLVYELCENWSHCHPIYSYILEPAHFERMNNSFKLMSTIYQNLC